MAYNISSFAGAGAQFFDDNGVPLVGGLLYVYTAGTTTPATTWTTNSAAVANTNPIVLDAGGRTPNEIWVSGGVNYKFVLKTSTGVTIGTYDNLPAIDDPGVFNNLITVTGTNTLLGTSVPPYTAYVAGMTLSFVPVNANTGAVTISVDGLGAKEITVGASSVLSGGELVVGQIANVQYDGTRFQITKAILADGSVTAAKLASGAAVSNIGYTPANDTAVVHLTGAETVAGVKTFSSSPVVPTPASTDNSTKAASTAYARAIDLGVDQTWQDVKTTPGRVAGTTYTNSTGKPIQVAITCTGTQSQNATLVVGGVNVMQTGIGTSNVAWLGNVSGVVPIGATYSLVVVGATLSLWTELR